MELTKNQAVLDWIDQQVALTKPDQVIWIDGGEAQLEQLRQEACATGEMYKLNQEKLPGAISTGRTPPTWPGWRAGPSSAAKSRRTRVPPTTGWTPRRCMPNSTNSTTAP